MRPHNRPVEEKSMLRKTSNFVCMYMYYHLHSIGIETGRRTPHASYTGALCVQLEIDRSREEVHAHFQKGGVFIPPPPHSIIAPERNPITVHYAFDFAQQVHYPSNPMQPGLIYFLTPRKASIFGVCCEAIPRQVNFISDEASDTGKGANTVLSLLDYFFSNHGLGETAVSLHADNCSGQDKNNTMVQHLTRRVMTGLHHIIDLHFTITGHTNFSPDACFGLVKEKFRRTAVSTCRPIVI